MKRRVFVEQWWHSEIIVDCPKGTTQAELQKWVETNVPVEELEFQPNAPGEIDPGHCDFSADDEVGDDEAADYTMPPK
ncbi:MAG: hypothetical protein ACLQNE_07070 [Thermoguttaceae bacterium]|jgi:Zn ribbon nucleic-acid-binding protein